MTTVENKDGQKATIKLFNEAYSDGKRWECEYPDGVVEFLDGNEYSKLDILKVVKKRLG